MAGNITNMINLGIGVSVQGASKAKTEIDGVTTASEKLGTQTKTNTTQQAKFKTALGEFRQNLPNVASAVYLVQQAYSALSGAIETTTAAYEEQYAAEVKLQTILTSTGNAVGYTYDQIYNLAQSWQDLTGINDSVILQTSAIASTFTQISQEAFPGAIEQALNMSTIFGQDLKQSMIQLGTALNDPIRGLGRLRRIGISFTQEQREQTTALAEAGDMLGAQTVILEELEREIGATARAMGDTSLGAIKKYETAWENLFEEIGERATNFKATIAESTQGAVEAITQYLKEGNARAAVESYLDTGMTEAQAAQLLGMDDIQTAITAVQNELQSQLDATLRYDYVTGGLEQDEALLAYAQPVIDSLEEEEEVLKRLLLLREKIASAEEKAAADAKLISDAQAEKNRLAELEEAYAKYYAFREKAELAGIDDDFAKRRRELELEWLELRKEAWSEHGLTIEELNEKTGNYYAVMLAIINAEEEEFKLKQKQTEEAERQKELEEQINALIDAREGRMDFLSTYGTEAQQKLVEFNEALFELDEWLEKGSISMEEYNDAVTKLGKEFHATTSPLESFMEGFTGMDQAISDAQRLNETMSDLGATLQDFAIDTLSDGFYELGYAITNAADASTLEDFALAATESLLSTVGPALISAGAQQLAATAGVSPIGWALLAAGASMTVGAGAISGLIDSADSSSSSSSSAITTDTETAYTFDTSSVNTDDSSKSTIIVNNNTNSNISTEEDYSDTGEKITKIIVDTATKNTANSYGLSKVTKPVA